jgi:hypothetical protein
MTSNQLRATIGRVFCTSLKIKTHFEWMEVFLPSNGRRVKDIDRRIGRGEKLSFLI